MYYFSKKVKTILSSEFLRNSASLISGSTIAQLISIGTAPILYRIYSKNDYGVLGLYMATTATISAFSTLQYTQAILIEKDDIDAKNALWLVRLLNIFLAFTVFIILIFKNKYFGELLGTPSISNWLFMMPISILFNGQNEIFRIWANRKKAYSIMSSNSIQTAILVPVVSISLGIILEGPTGLFIGLLISQLVPAIFLTYKMSKKEVFGLSTLNIDGIKKIIKRHKNLPIYSFPSEFINRITNQLPVFFLNSVGGAATVGVYNLSTRIIGLPISLISSSVSEVFRQKAISDFHDNGDCQLIFNQTLKVLFTISILPTILILSFGPNIFSLIFGENWREAGVYSQILIILFMCKFIVSPLSYMYILRNKLKEEFVIHIYFLLSNLTIFYLLSTYSIYTTLIIYCINYVATYIFTIIRSHKFTRIKS